MPFVAVNGKLKNKLILKIYESSQYLFYLYSVTCEARVEYPII